MLPQEEGMIEQGRALGEWYAPKAKAENVVLVLGETVADSPIHYQTSKGALCGAKPTQAVVDTNQLTVTYNLAVLALTKVIVKVTCTECKRKLRSMAKRATAKRLKMEIERD